MAFRRGALTRTSILATVLVVAVLAVSGIFLLATSSSGESMIAAEHQTTFSSGVSPEGLRLQVELNTTSIKEGGSLTARIYLFNTLDKNVSLYPNLSAIKGFARWDSSNSACGISPVFDAFSFAVFQGHYTSANISQAAQPLGLSVPSLGCPFIAGRTYQKIVLAPNSDVATITGNTTWKNNVWTVRMQLNATTGYCKATQGLVTLTKTGNGTESTTLVEEPGSQCFAGTSLTGYWTSAIGNPHPLTAGQYTLVAEDEWGQTVFAYFQAGVNP